jgi:caffeoyl-CoA O-methyltransferase
VNLIDAAIDRYLHELHASTDPILREMEALAAERTFPIVGPQVGTLLHLLARTCGARRVFELGSGFGYSAHWFARAVGPEGRVVCTDRSAEQAAEAEAFLRRAGLADRVRFEVGDALETLARIGGTYDIVFNDIDKERYPLVLEAAAAALRPGCLLISDNMLWSGAVLERAPAEASTRGVQELTRRLYASPAFETILLPVRDGVTVSIYRG